MSCQPRLWYLSGFQWLRSLLLSCSNLIRDKSPVQELQGLGSIFSSQTERRSCQRERASVKQSLLLLSDHPSNLQAPEETHPKDSQIWWRNICHPDNCLRTFFPVRKRLINNRKGEGESGRATESCSLQEHNWWSDRNKMGLIFVLFDVYNHNCISRDDDTLIATHVKLGMP